MADNKCKCPRGKLHCTDWLADIPGGFADCDIVEVQFKNTRKGFYRNSTNLPLEIGDMVAVEATPGHDIGCVSLVGDLVRLQMKKVNVRQGTEIKRVFRKARPADLEKYEEAKARENDTMIRARKIASSLNLNMKIGDVEYLGDDNKAIFYYIADERVDFRQLIKVLAETFKVRIEMKQIGARQEAGRIGGIGPCGRPLCCSSWMTNFVSVATSAARFQDISLNPQKLAGQCAKLKCCLNFEADMYVEAVKRMPSRDIHLETADNTYYHFKTDIFKRQITYSTDKSLAANLVTIDASRAFEVIAMNKAGEKPLSLLPDNTTGKEPQRKPLGDILDDNDLTRFDKKKKKRKLKKSVAKVDVQGGPVINESTQASPVNAEKHEKAEKPDRQDKPQRADAQDKPPRNRNRRDRTENQKPKNGRPEKQDKPRKPPIDRYAKPTDNNE